MTVPIAGEVLFTIRGYPDLVEAFRTVKARLGLSNAWVDEICGWCEGIADKKLGPSQSKPIGPIDFTTFCQIFAVQLEMKIDLDAVKEMEAVWQGRAERNVRKIESRISKTIIERAKPHVSREMGRKGGLKSASLPIAQQVRRKGGKMRAKKLSKAQRREIARKAGKASAAKRAARSAVSLNDDMAGQAIAATMPVL